MVDETFSVLSIGNVEKRKVGLSTPMYTLQLCLQGGK